MRNTMPRTRKSLSRGGKLSRNGHFRRLAVEVLESRWFLSGVMSVSPNTATQGTTNLTVTINLSTSATPPVPPANVAPATATIGTISGTSITHVSQYVVTAIFAIPSSQAVSSYDVGVTFSTPNGTA